MRCCIVRNLGRGLPDYTEGQVVDLDQAEAELLVPAGLAEPLEPAKPAPKPKPIEAVPGEPADTAAPPVRGRKTTKTKSKQES